MGGLGGVTVKIVETWREKEITWQFEEKEKNQGLQGEGRKKEKKRKGSSERWMHGGRDRKNLAGDLGNKFRNEGEKKAEWEMDAGGGQQRSEGKEV